MDDIIKPTNLTPAEIIPSGLTPSELTPDAMSDLNTKIAIIIGSIVALIAILILAAFFIQKGKEYFHNKRKDKRKDNIKENNAINTELDNEIKKYQKNIYDSCEKSKNQINIEDNDLKQLINSRREKLDQKYTISIQKNENYTTINNYQITFCEDKFEEAINQFNKIKQLRDKNNPEINKILLDLLKSTGNTQSLFEVYRGEGTINLLNRDKQGEYIQNTNLNVIEHNLFNKYQKKITKTLNENKLDKANKIVKIFKMLLYYERVTNFVIGAKNQDEYLDIIKKTYPNIKDYEFSDEFISKFQKVLKDEYFYSLIDLKFEYEEVLQRMPCAAFVTDARANATLSLGSSNKSPEYSENDKENYQLILNDLNTVIENIIKANPQYTHLYSLTKEQFQKADKENFEQTLKFIDENKVVERMNEVMNQSKNPPSNNVNLGHGGRGHGHD